MENTILINTHHSGVIEMNLKKFEWLTQFYNNYFPEYDRTSIKKKIENKEKIDYDWSWIMAMKQRRREFSKTDKFRKNPIKGTNINWWRSLKLRQKRNPKGRRQQVQQYQIDSKYLGLNISKPEIAHNHRKYDDPIWMKKQKSWKKNKKVKKQWMKKKAKHESIKEGGFTIFDESEGVPLFFFPFTLESILEEIFYEI